MKTLFAISLALNVTLGLYLGAYAWRYDTLLTWSCGNSNYNASGYRLFCK